MSGVCGLADQVQREVHNGFDKMLSVQRRMLASFLLSLTTQSVLHVLCCQVCTACLLCHGMACRLHHAQTVVGCIALVWC